MSTTPSTTSGEPLDQPVDATQPITPAQAPPAPPAEPFATPAAPRAPRASDGVPLGWVIAAVVLFWPTAIPALLASHRAARAAGSGDAVAAARDGAVAKRWSVVSVCVGAGLLVLSALVSVVWSIAAIAWHHDHDGTWPGGGSSHAREVPPRGDTGPGQGGFSQRGQGGPRTGQGSDDQGSTQQQPGRAGRGSQNGTTPGGAVRPTPQPTSGSAS